MFSSGTTGAPKCIVHSVGGTLLQHRKEHCLHTNLTAADTLFFYTTCGWMMWNWLVSALAGGTRVCLYDGSPFFPDASVLLQFAESEGVTHMGLSPGYLSQLAKLNYEVARQHPGLVLRTVLSTGSPLPDPTFYWVAEQFGSDVQLSSISGGTDILGCFALGNPFSAVTAGEIQGPALGMDVQFYANDGTPVVASKGELVCSNAFPSQPIGFWNDPNDEKYHAAYYALFDNCWHHGDFGEISASGGIRIHGRSDAVLNRGGVRIGTAELYRQVEHVLEVVESVAVAQQYDNETRIILFVRLTDGLNLSEELAKQIKKTIRAGTSPRHVPDLVLQVSDIPRTRSGKIVELAITRVINGEPVNNTSALANPEALAQFKDLPELRRNP
jgi:acetoacetyl-CoA synthetase